MIDKEMTEVFEDCNMSLQRIEKWAAAFHQRRSAQKFKWVGLTDEEILNLQDVYDVTNTDYARAIEAKLKQKNGG